MITARLITAACTLGLLVGGAAAQGVSLAGSPAGSPAALDPASLQLIHSGQDVTFALLASAGDRLTWKTTQVRRFRDETNNFVAVREQLTAAGNGSRQPPFRLAFQGLDGQSPPPEQVQRWTELYRRNASLLHEHGGFRVYDAAAAARNYTIHPFGTGFRAGRATERVVVFPRRFDKAIWLLEVDRVTALVLYSAEFDPQARLLGELEVLTLQTGSQVGPLANGWAWRPRMHVTQFATAEAARSQVALQNPDSKVLAVPGLGSVVPDYGFHTAQLSENLLNGVTSLVLAYTDGIDAFFVIQAPNQLDPFQGLPTGFHLPQRAQPNTIAYFDDPSLRVYLFHHGGVGFTVAGRGALGRLGEVARTVYRQVLR